MSRRGPGGEGGLVNLELLQLIFSSFFFRHVIIMSPWHSPHWFNCCCCCCGGGGCCCWMWMGRWPGWPGLSMMWMIMWIVNSLQLNQIEFWNGIDHLGAGCVETVGWSCILPSRWPVDPQGLQFKINTLVKANMKECPRKIKRKACSRVWKEHTWVILGGLLAWRKRKWK